MHLPAHQIGRARRAASVGGVDEVNPGRVLKQGAAEVVRATNAARGIAELARAGLGRRDQILDAAPRRIRSHHEHERATLDQANGLQILLGIEIELFEERRIDRQRGQVAHAQGVAIGLGARDGFGANIAPRARFVVDHDGLAQNCAHHLGHLARACIGIAAGRIRTNPTDGLAGVLLLGPAGHGGCKAERTEQGLTTVE